MKSEIRKWGAVILASLRKDASGFALLALVVALSAVYFRSGLNALWKSWETPEYSYGYFVPLIACGWGILIGQRRSIKVQPLYYGLVAIAFAIFMHAFGVLAANDWISQYAIVVFIAAFCLSLLGKAAFWELSPALFFLSAAVPLSAIPMAELTAGMQLVSSAVSVWGLHLIGVPVFREGNIIDLGLYKLQVAEACSGLRYLFPLLTFSYLLAFAFEKSRWKRLILIVSAVPVTIVMNALRIVVIGVTVDRMGVRMAEGLVHDFEGYVAFGGCLLLLLLEMGALSLVRTAPTAVRAPAERAAATAHDPESSRQGATWSKPICLVTLGLLALGIGGQNLIGSEPAVDLSMQRPISDFPLTLGDWKGRRESLTDDDLKTLNLSDYFLASYRDDQTAEPAVNFYVAWYASQRHGASPHSPLVCLPGSGWEIESLDANYVIRAADGHELFKVNRALIKNGEEAGLVYFWFREQGVDLTGTWQRKQQLFRSALLEGRTDGALLRLVILLPKGGKTEDADARLASFMNAALPQLNDFLPH